MDVRRGGVRLMRPVRTAVRLVLDSSLALTSTSTRLAKVLMLKALRATDHQRWANPSNLESWWDARTKLLAELVPAASHVIEFGAGRRQLEHYLDPSCTYVPSDLVDRGPGTIVCDLNRRPRPDLTGLALDVAVFGGVLEYIVDTNALVEWLAPSVRYCVASYAHVERDTGVADRVARYVERWRNGYMNHYTEDQLVAVFAKQGFSCRERRSWQSQRLFLFERDRRGA